MTQPNNDERVAALEAQMTQVIELLNNLADPGLPLRAQAAAVQAVTNALADPYSATALAVRNIALNAAVTPRAATEQGLVLTDTENLTTLAGKAHKLPWLKVVTGWGVKGGWTAQRVAYIYNHWRNVILRTVVGNNTPVIDASKLEAELAPWLTIRRAGQSVLVELGNEPNINDESDQAAWQWAYYLKNAIDTVRNKFPSVPVSLISGGLAAKPRVSRWIEIAAPVLAECDYIGVHGYGWHHLFGAEDTQQLQMSLNAVSTYLPGKPILITEAGINDMSTPPVEKAKRYKAALTLLPQTVRAILWYHWCENPLDDDQRAYALDTAALEELQQ